MVHWTISSAERPERKRKAGAAETNTVATSATGRVFPPRTPRITVPRQNRRN
jgi:hypothetical protein